MLCTNYTLFSPVFLGIFTLFSADTKYGYYVGMRANLLHYLHLLDQVVHFLLRAVLLNKRTFTRLSFHTWDQTFKWCLTMLQYYNTPLKVGRSTKPSLMASLVSKDTSPHCLRPLRHATSIPIFCGDKHSLHVCLRVYCPVTLQFCVIASRDN